MGKMGSVNASSFGYIHAPQSGAAKIAGTLKPYVCDRAAPSRAKPSRHLRRVPYCTSETHTSNTPAQTLILEKCLIITKISTWRGAAGDGAYTRITDVTY